MRLDDRHRTSVPFVVLDNADELVDRLVEVVVDHDLVVAILQRELAPGKRQTKRKGIIPLRAAVTQALGEHLERRRLYEDEHGFGHALAHLQGTLDIDLEDKR